METRGFGLSDVGRQRSNNEDALLIDDELGLYVVCDGVGGHAAGETASRLAVEACRASVRGDIRVVASARDGTTEHTELRAVARTAVAAACRDVYEQATGRPELSGMGCTMTLLLVAGSRGVMAHVGDTRLYLCRDGAAWQLSSDHTLAADLVRKGELTPEQMPDHPYANALTRAIGGQLAVEPETLILDVLPDDTFLLCSDGLSGYLDGLGELAPLLLDSDLARVPEELVTLANERGGQDNVTALVVQTVATDDEQSSMLTLADDLRLDDRALLRVPLFQNLRFADRLRILEIAECRSVGPGETLFGVGEELHGLYVPVSGELDLVTPDGQTQRVAPGSSVGATSLLVPRSSWAALRTTGEVRILVIDGVNFQELAQRRPWLGVSLMSELARGLSGELAAAGEQVVESPVKNLGWWDPRRWL